MTQEIACGYFLLWISKQWQRLLQKGCLLYTSRMVDVEKVRDIIDDIRLNMPAEIRQAKAIVQDLSLIHIYCGGASGSH